MYGHIAGIINIITQCHTTQGNPDARIQRGRATIEKFATHQRGLGHNNGVRLRDAGHVEKRAGTAPKETPPRQGFEHIMQPLPQFLGRDWPQHIKIVRARYLTTVQGGQERLVDLDVHLTVKPAPQSGRVLGQAIGHDLGEVVQRAGIRHR